MSTPSSRPRVAFVGNCQAQAMNSLTGHLNLPVDVVTVPPVFDLGAFNTPEVWAKLESCEFVFNQRVADNYACDFARPAFLAHRFGQRSVSWPNIYFDGYFPGIEYVYKTGGKVVGPLSDYHFRFVRAAWARGVEPDRLEADFVDGDLGRSFARSAEASLYQLRLRESGLTVRMSDVVCARWRYTKALHTMNHPDNHLLAVLLRRLLKHADVDVKIDPLLLASYPYPLNEITIPAFPSIHRMHALGFPNETQITGKRMALEDGQWRMQSDAATYSWRSLFEAYYRLYDSEAAASHETNQHLRNV